MRNKLHVKKGDTVAVITGKQKGARGEILSVDTKNERVTVKGVNVRTLHKRQSQTEQGGIVREERSIHVSNVMHVDPKSDKPTRMKRVKQEDGSKVRVAVKSGESLDK